MGLDLSAYLEDFRAEAGEHLRALDAQLLALERDPADPAPIRAMFLAAHSLKGSGAMMDLADVEALAHAVEDVLARLRGGEQRLDSATADRLFRAFDLLGERVGRAAPGASPVDAPIAAMIAALATVEAAAPIVAAPAPPPMESPRDCPVALLVEASPTVRLLHAALLSGAGCDVDVAMDGQEALLMAGVRRYDLIVSGLATGHLRGPDLATALHERIGAAMPPFILMHHDDADAIGDAWIAAHLRTAPPARERLTATVSALLAHAARD
ncbi:MAG: Hpt domain-containing protein [Thermomicrobiales bacterium]